MACVNRCVRSAARSASGFLRGAWLVVSFVSLALLPAAARAAPAADQVVNDCSNDAELRNDLLTMQNNSGGTLTFACGAASIVLTNNVLPNIDAPTIVDGGGLITLSGGNAYRIFTTGAGGSLTLKNITLTLGRAGGAGTAGDGGCIWNYGTLTLDGATVHHCHANRDGGAIYNYSGGSVYIVNSTLRQNTATLDCGAICDYGSLVSVSGSSILTNTAQGGDGGGMGGFGFAQLSDSTVRGNIAAIRGGGLHTTGYVALTNVTLSHNYAYNCGGGLFVRAGTMAVYASTIYGNGNWGNVCAGNGGLTGGGGGGAVWGVLAVSDSTLEANSSSNNGGGLYVENGGTAALTRVALIGNYAGNQGGGIAINGGVITVTNTTFQANVGANHGGSINVNNASGPTSVSLANATLAGNRVQYAGVGGIRISGGSLQLLNTILADNQNGNCNGTVSNAGFNLSDDGSCYFGAGFDYVDPLLGPFGNHGGFTKTFLPKYGSPAVDTGTLLGCPPTDQRGHPRPVGLTCDVGAVERRPGDLSDVLWLPLIRR